MWKTAKRFGKVILQIFIWLLGGALLFLFVWSGIHCHWSAYTWPPVILTSEQIVERQKTVWEWLELLVVPVAIALSAIAFGWMERKNDRKIAETQRQEDRQTAKEQRKQDQEIADKRIAEERRISEERTQDSALESYLTQISTLLLETELAQVRTATEARNVARAWTLTVLPRLDVNRKGFVIRFLHEAGLIRDDNPAISLEKADLREVELYNINLVAINLTGAQLEEANFCGSKLMKARLAGANTWMADFTKADLRGADLRVTFNAPLHAVENPDLLFATARFHGASYSASTKPPQNVNLANEGAIQAND